MKNINKKKTAPVLVSILLILSFTFIIVNNLSLVSSEEVFPDDYDVYFGLDNNIEWYDWIISGLFSTSLLSPGGFLFYQDYSADVFLYRAGAWRPPTDGDCNSCNNLGYLCGDYQCHSLGTTCNIINKGSDHELCWDNESQDILPPEIFPMEEVLEPGYVYVEFGASFPDEYGVIIKNTKNPPKYCIPPFTAVTLAVKTDEPAICKIDPLRPTPYDEMAEIMGYDFYTYEHEVILPASGFPNEEALQGIDFELELEYEYDYFIRCKDYKGNVNLATFDMEFCIQEGPDNDAPEIIETNAPIDGFVGFNTSVYPLEIFTDEPADCRWDFQDLDYEKMNYNMSDCSYNLADYFQFPYYGCRTNLTGIQSGQENNYFIRCKDKPWWNASMTGTRVKNSQSYPITLLGTYPLQIDSITANQKQSGAIFWDSVEPVSITLEVKTSSGANEGKSKCQYGVNGAYIDYFFNDGNFDFLTQHSQDIYLGTGEYTYDIKCNDEANNVIEDSINFTIKLDNVAPIVTRIYYEQGNLKLITNEDAKCFYSTATCNFPYEDGIQMNTNDGFNHFVDWNTEMDLYIKCEDLFNNMPINECSIKARAFEE